MERIGLFVILLGIWGCGEKPDELGPYVSKLKGLQHYNATLAQYSEYLRTEGMTDKARDLAEVLRAYEADLRALGTPKEKRLRAIHNDMLRAFGDAQRRLVEPDFPTFVPNAQRAVSVLMEKLQVAMRNLERLWKRAGKPEPFPLKWP